LPLLQVKLKSQKTKTCKKEKKIHRKSNRHQEFENVKFSASKLERMKRLAQLLSKQIATINKQGKFQ
jgi:hypothetical protein